MIAAFLIFSIALILLAILNRLSKKKGQSQLISLLLCAAIPLIYAPWYVSRWTFWVNTVVVAFVSYGLIRKMQKSPFQVPIKVMWIWCLLSYFVSMVVGFLLSKHLARFLWPMV